MAPEYLYIRPVCPTACYPLQVAGLGHGHDALLCPERHTQGSVQKYSKNTQVFPDLCTSGGKTISNAVVFLIRYLFKTFFGLLLSLIVQMQMLVYAAYSVT